MNSWQPNDWDRGYEAGRKAGLAEAKPASLKNIAFDTGVIAERERIIKLLEDNLYYAEYEGIFRKSGGLSLDVQDIIALIKGEQK